MTIQDLQTKSGALSTLSSRLRDLVFVAFDTETTGLSPIACRLVELSGVKFRLDGTELSTFQALIDPETPIPPTATAVHGITDDMVGGQPTYEDVIPEFINWATVPDDDTQPVSNNPTVLLAHNAPFDIGFLEVAMCKLGLDAPSNFVVDTLPLARQLVLDSPNYQLRTLVEHLRIAADTYHRALADSQHVRHLFCRMMMSLPDETTLEDLISLAGRLHFMDRSQAQQDGYWDSQPEFITIKQAIADGSDLRISYSGVRKTNRVVTPRSVLFTGGSPYLSAFCHMASAERTFRIDRIVSMETLGRRP